jgi:hypothetical protein
MAKSYISESRAAESEYPHGFTIHISWVEDKFLQQMAANGNTHQPMLGYESRIIMQHH